VPDDRPKRLAAITTVLWRGVAQDAVELRRGGHSAERLKMERERLEREREKTEEEIIEHFKRWVRNPAVRDWVCQAWVTPEERERRMREIFGLEPKAEEETSPEGEPESDSIRPNQTE
jgi:hypothetical protein